jgi:hypothetical protein
VGSPVVDEFSPYDGWNANPLPRSGVVDFYPFVCLNDLEWPVSRVSRAPLLFLDGVASLLGGIVEPVLDFFE